MKSVKCDVIAICDSEKTYACHLMEYLEENHSIPLEISVYTSIQKLLADPNHDKIALLVISESEYSREIQQAGFPEILVLNESGCNLGEEIKSIGKYQSMEKITECIAGMLAESEESADMGAMNRMRQGCAMKRIAFYTPVSRCLQTTTALCMAQLLARDQKTLYMNFEDEAGFSAIAPNTQGNSIDLLYYNDCAKSKVATQLQRRIVHIGGADVIAPASNFEELHSITEEQWLGLFDTINQVSEYQAMILDLDSGCQGLEKILESCDVIYTIEGSDPISCARLNNYGIYLQKKGLEKIIAKTIKLSLPYFDRLPGSFEKLGESDLGNWICKNMLSEK